MQLSMLASRQICSVKRGGKNVVKLSYASKEAQIKPKRIG
jgi:hypothetical protein